MAGGSRFSKVRVIPEKESLQNYPGFSPGHTARLFDFLYRFPIYSSPGKLGVRNLLNLDAAVNIPFLFLVVNVAANKALVKIFAFIAAPPPFAALFTFWIITDGFLPPPGFLFFQIHLNPFNPFKTTRRARLLRAVLVVVFNSVYLSR